MLRPLAIAVALQLLAVPVLHGFAPCHALEDGHDECAHSQVASSEDAAAHDAIHTDTDHPAHGPCHCPCHARVLTVPAPSVAPIGRMARHESGRSQGPPPWRAERPPTPPPQA